MRKLLEAHLLFVSGAREVRIEHEGTQVEYRKTEHGRLIATYNQLSESCGYPDGFPPKLSFATKEGDAGTVKRGRPMRAQYW